MGKSEGYVENYLVAEAEKRDFLVYKFTSPGTNGVPDRCIIGNGKTVFVETKAKGNVPRPLQQVVIADMQAHGAIVFVASTRTAVDEVLDFIQNS